MVKVASYNDKKYFDEKKKLNLEDIEVRNIDELEEYFSNK